MRLFPGFGFELTKLFSDQGLDFFFAKAEVHGLGYELFDGRTDLSSPGFNLERGRLMGDIGAKAAPGLHEIFTLQDLINLGDGQGIDSQFRGKIAHGRELRAIRDLSSQDALLELLLKLHVERNSAVGIQ